MLPVLEVFDGSAANDMTNPALSIAQGGKELKTLTETSEVCGSRAHDRQLIRVLVDTPDLLPQEPGDLADDDGAQYSSTPSCVFSQRMIEYSGLENG